MEQNKTSNTDLNRPRQALRLGVAKKRNFAKIVSLTITVVLFVEVEPLLMKFIIDKLTNGVVVDNVAKGLAALLVLGLSRETIAASGNTFTWQTRIGIHYSMLGETVGRRLRCRRP